MHDENPTNASVVPQTTITCSAEGIRTLADGRRALVLSYASVPGIGLAFDAAALATAWRGSGQLPDLALLVPDGVDPDVLLTTATACTPRTPLLASQVPVTDAVKRVDGPMVTETLDRAGLRWATGPVAIDGPTFAAMLDVGGRVVRPLADPAVPIAWW